VAYQDGELLVLAKPAGLPTQPGSGWTDSVATRLKGLGGDFAPTPVHRLDKDTSGLLLAARTYGCLRRLQDLLRDRLAGKVYLAWVEGRLTPGVVLELRDRLAKAGPAGRERVQAGMEEGKEALAEALPLAVRAGGGGEATLVAVRLLTGRTHQIRVQLASRGHAVVGDRKYGGPGRGRAGGLLLHAWRLDLPERTFELAPDWAGAWTVREEDLAAAREWADR
jgi:23S rRNA pseudouridine955/2504/2580 synthase